MPSHTLAELAQRFGLELKGEGAVAIHGVCALAPGEPGCIGFLANPRYRSQLRDTAAAAVIVGRKDAAAVVNALVAPDPYLAFARIAGLFDVSAAIVPGVSPAAIVAPGAIVPASAHVDAGSVIEEGAELGEQVYVGALCVVQRGARIGAGTRLEGRVFVGERVRIGARCRINPGAVIGGRGFGLARGPQGWEEVPQLGGVEIGNDVEVGANTCIDRGAIGDTVLGDGVKLDNLVQIAHNVRIGAHTAIAAQAGVAGSTTIGQRCMIGGASSVSGHLEIGDDVVLLGRSMVTKNLPDKGVYGSGLPISDARDWRRTVARIRRLGQFGERLKKLEQHLNLVARDEGDERDPDDV